MKQGPWLIEHFKAFTGNCAVGVDPFLMSHKQWSSLEQELKEGGHELVAVQQNLVDLVWGAEKPARPANPITILEVIEILHFA